MSVTDRCNLRCQYCMPEEEYAWLPREDLLSFEEIVRAVDAFASLGVDKVRLTGGEPLLRRNLPDLVRLLAADRRLTDLALTTNGVLLAEQAERASRRRADARDRQPRHAAPRPLHGAHPAHEPRRACSKASRYPPASSTPSRSTPSSCAASTTTNWCRCSSTRARVGAEVRFIEYMDVGGATQWSPDKVMSGAEILERLAGALRPDRAGRRDDVGPGRSVPPARRHRLRTDRLHDVALLHAPATGRG